MITLRIVDKRIGCELEVKGNYVTIPRIGDKINMRKYQPEPTVTEVLLDYKDNGDMIAIVSAS